MSRSSRSLHEKTTQWRGLSSHWPRDVLVYLPDLTRLCAVPSHCQRHLGTFYFRNLEEEVHDSCRFPVLVYYPRSPAARAAPPVWDGSPTHFLILSDGMMRGPCPMRGARPDHYIASPWWFHQINGRILTLPPVPAWLCWPGLGGLARAAVLPIEAQRHHQLYGGHVPARTCASPMRTPLHPVGPHPLVTRADGRTVAAAAAVPLAAAVPVAAAVGAQPTTATLWPPHHTPPCGLSIPPPWSSWGTRPRVFLFLSVIFPYASSTGSNAAAL